MISAGGWPEDYGAIVRTVMVVVRTLLLSEAADIRRRVNWCEIV